MGSMPLFTMPASRDWLEGFSWGDGPEASKEGDAAVRRLKQDLDRELMECASLAKDAEMMAQAAREGLGV